MHDGFQFWGKAALAQVSHLDDEESREQRSRSTQAGRDALQGSLAAIQREKLAQLAIAGKISC
jgi:hypothetical protein